MRQISNLSYIFRGDKTPRDQLLSIAISVDPEFEQYGNIDAWFEHYKMTEKDPDDPASNPIYPNFKHTEVAGVPAVRWFVPGPGGYTKIAFGKGKWLYQIAAVPGNSRYRKLFERVVSSFQIP